MLLTSARARHTRRVRYASVVHMTLFNCVLEISGIKSMLRFEGFLKRDFFGYFRQNTLLFN